MMRALIFTGVAAALKVAPTAAQTPAAKGVYRLPYPDGTEVNVGNDHTTHPPPNRVDLTAANAGTKVVAAGAGTVRRVVDNNDTFCPGTPFSSLSQFDTNDDNAISDTELQTAFNASLANQTTIQNAFTARCSNYPGPSAFCCVRTVTAIGQTCQWMGAPDNVTCGAGDDEDGPNNYIWIEHPNGEWTKYSHIHTDSALVSEKQNVVAGEPLGTEGDVGNAGGRHVHFEVADIDSIQDISDTGFVVDVDNVDGVNLRNRVPTFCQVGLVEKGVSETATKCDDKCANASEAVGGAFNANNSPKLIQATNTVTTTANVQSSGSLALRAGQSITLLPGFSAVSGGFFATEIGACDAPGGTGDG